MIADMRAWLSHHRARVAAKSPLGKALAYIAKYWDGLCIFLTDGRIEIDKTSTLAAIVNGHKQSEIDELLPWNYPASHCNSSP